MIVYSKKYKNFSDVLSSLKRVSDSAAQSCGSWQINDFINCSRQHINEILKNHMEGGLFSDTTTIYETGGGVLFGWQQKEEDVTLFVGYYREGSITSNCIQEGMQLIVDKKENYMEELYNFLGIVEMPGADKIKSGNFTWITSFKEVSAYMNSYDHSEWETHYHVVKGNVEVVYTTKKGFHSSQPDPGRGYSGSSEKYDKKPIGEPLVDVDFIYHTSNITSSGCGNGPWSTVGNGACWADYIKEHYPNISLP